MKGPAVMRKTLFAALLAALPLLAVAEAVAWTPHSTTAKCWLPGPLTSQGVTPAWTYKNANCRSVVGACTTGTCADIDATTGMSLAGVATVRVKVCPAAGQKLTGGSVVLWTVDATSPAQWLYLTVPNVNVADRCAELEGNSPGLGIPVLGSRGRLVPVPAVTVDAGGITITVTATGLAGQDL